MGLSESAYFSSWLFHYFIYFTVISLLDTLILTQILDDSSFFLVWLWIWLFCMTFFGKAVLLSSLFTSAKLGIVFGICIWFMEAVMHDVCYANRRNMDVNTQFWVAINPFIATSFSGDIFLALDAGGIGLNFSNLGFEYNNFKVGYQLFWCSIIAIVTTTLGIYLE